MKILGVMSAFSGFALVILVIYPLPLSDYLIALFGVVMVGLGEYQIGRSE